ncbi:hypothetical protein PIB30_023625 [Stylosanthes scabra]|uniref:Uncharacterized protein n=1 Tax=Stylosanthes scabra TaxID=79078 RepID=A0ABU6Q957_9FABA|nr:hypothetical protein [Stylosanthes scabra]
MNRHWFWSYSVSRELMLPPLSGVTSNSFKSLGFQLSIWHFNGGPQSRRDQVEQVFEHVSFIFQESVPTS